MSDQKIALVTGGNREIGYAIQRITGISLL